MQIDNLLSKMVYTPLMGPNNDIFRFSIRFFTLFPAIFRCMQQRSKHNMCLQIN